METQGVNAIFSRLRDYWEQTGAEPRPGVSSAEVTRAERRLRLRFSSSLWAYFMHVNGTKGPDQDNFEAWPLDQIVPLRDHAARATAVPELLKQTEALRYSDQYVVFGDWLIDSVLFAVRLTGDDAETTVVTVGGSPTTIVAATFMSFWERYFDDRARLFDL